ncbi:MAG: hypothetical protein AB7R67_20225 [Vicinamibacterales bacterium]
MVTASRLRRAILVAFVGATLASCDTITGASNIEYRIGGGAARVSVTYQSSSDGTSQAASVTPPWSYSWKAKRGDFLYVSAQVIQGNGTVIVSIYKDGDLVDSAQGTGFGAIATASGTNDD